MISFEFEAEHPWIAWTSLADVILQRLKILAAAWQVNYNSFQ